jgi:diguanylate cyclase (GGDEF)-like protein
VFNDQFGICAGDDMLKQVAELLDSLTNRAADMVSRYDGDEFFILLPGTELNNALLLATRMMAGIALLGTPIGNDDNAGLLSASAGVATIEPSADKHRQSLVDEAGDMLERARQRGGNQVEGVAI